MFLPKEHMSIRNVYNHIHNTSYIYVHACTCVHIYVACQRRATQPPIQSTLGRAQAASWQILRALPKMAWFRWLASGASGPQRLAARLLRLRLFSHGDRNFVYGGFLKWGYPQIIQYESEVCSRGKPSIFGGYPTLRNIQIDPENTKLDYSTIPTR